MMDGEMMYRVSLYMDEEDIVRWMRVDRYTYYKMRGVKDIEIRLLKYRLNHSETCLQYMLHDSRGRLMAEGEDGERGWAAPLAARFNSPVLPDAILMRLFHRIRIEQSIDFYKRWTRTERLLDSIDNIHSRHYDYIPDDNIEQYINNSMQYLSIDDGMGQDTSEESEKHISYYGKFCPVTYIPALKKTYTRIKRKIGNVFK